MNFVFDVQTDVGTTKEVNQDAVAVKIVATGMGNVLFAVICDGMGGFDKGEVASASMLQSMLKWFDNDFPDLKDDFTDEDLFAQWNYIIQSMNEKISNYGRTNQIRLGTTLSALLLFKNHYCFAHVGDSRIYKLQSMSITQITKDHTVAEEKLKKGEITEDQIETDEDRNVLTQCVGASRRVNPQFGQGTAEAEDLFLLCTDGFRHEISKTEIVESLNPKNNQTNKDIIVNIASLIERDKQRNEEDNITAAAIKIKA